MHCTIGRIRFLNRFATHPVQEVGRELGKFLTKLLLFRKDEQGKPIEMEIDCLTNPRQRARLKPCRLALPREPVEMPPYALIGLDQFTIPFPGASRQALIF
jgi:hypothetical protein